MRLKLVSTDILCMVAQSGLIEGFHINSFGYLSTSGQTAGFVIRSKGTPTMSSTENIDTTEVIGSRVRQIYINKDNIY